MSIDLKKWLLVLGLQFVLVSSAAAQVAPFNPFTEPSDFQYFVQPDLSPYGSGVPANTGWFAGVEYLLWATTTPNRTQIGAPDGQRLVYGGNHNFILQTNSADTSFIRGALTSGTRYEIGFMTDEGKGWFFSGYNMNPTVSTLLQTDASMVFQEPSFPVFDNRSAINGVGGDAAYEIIGNFPALYGFVDNEGPFGAPGQNLPDGFADDVDRDNLFGPSGRDSDGTFNRQPSLELFTPNNTAPQVPPQPAPNASPGPPVNPTNAYQPIDYGDLVPLPVLFTQIKASHKTSNYSVEFNRQWRLRSTPTGGSIDVFAGPRYINFNDQLLVDAIGGILADSYWNTRADNRVIGGQAGFRVNKKNGRLSLMAEGRMFSGASLQTVRLNGQIGSQLTQTVQNPVNLVGTSIIPVPGNQGGAPAGGNIAPATINQPITIQQANNPGLGTPATRLNQPINSNPTSFASSRNYVSFAPLGELRTKVQYQVFDSLSVNAGWTGTWIDGMMRANNMIDYTLPSLQISSNRNIQGVFMNGFNLGVEMNR